MNKSVCFSCSSCKHICDSFKETDGVITDISVYTGGYWARCQKTKAHIYLKKIVVDDQTFLNNRYCWELNKRLIPESRVQKINIPKSTYQIYQSTHFQNCSFCENADCTDNTTPSITNIKKQLKNNNLEQLKNIIQAHELFEDSCDVNEYIEKVSKHLNAELIPCPDFNEFVKYDYLHNECPEKIMLYKSYFIIVNRFNVFVCKNDIISYNPDDIRISLFLIEELYEIIQLLD